MAENLLITRMTSDDIDDVVLLERSIFYDPWARTSFSGSLKKDTCLVLRRDGELEGYAIFSSILTKANCFASPSIHCPAAKVMPRCS